MKKLIALMMALVMALSLAACGNQADSNSQAPSDDAGNSEAVTNSTEPSQSTEETISGPVTTLGSTSMETVMNMLAEQFNNDNEGVSVTVEGGGSGAGVEAALNGTADIGLASRALDEDEEAQGLVGTTLALDGIAIIVNAESGVTDLTLDQITQIYTGEITNWSEVGGNDAEIACMGREAGSGTRDGFESITGTDGLCVYAQELTSTGAVIEAVRSNPQAIGYASLSAVEGQDGIVAVTVDGVACTEETVLDGTYAIQRPFVLVTNSATELSPAAQAFFDWATSSAANELISAGGAVPVAE